MPPKAKITPNRHIHTTIDAALADRIEEFLFSELEGRVPKGAMQAFLTRQIQEFFSHRELDLAPYIGSMPAEFVVRGTPESIGMLEATLKGEHSGR
jgi:hypothetical protein